MVISHEILPIDAEKIISEVCQLKNILRISSIIFLLVLLDFLFQKVSLYLLSRRHKNGQYMRIYSQYSQITILLSTFLCTIFPMNIFQYFQPKVSKERILFFQAILSQGIFIKYSLSLLRSCCPDSLSQKVLLLSVIVNYNAIAITSIYTEVVVTGLSQETKFAVDSFKSVLYISNGIILSIAFLPKRIRISPLIDLYEPIAEYDIKLIHAQGLCVLLICIFFMMGIFTYLAMTWNDNNDTFILRGQLLTALLMSLSAKLLDLNSMHNRVNILQESQMIAEQELRLRLSYITEEIRCPLATSILGITCLKEMILSEQKDSKYEGKERKQGDDAFISDILDLVEDCKHKCTAAMHILNDLILYDGMISNTIKLQLSKYSSKRLLLECIRPYRRQMTLDRINFIVQVPSELSRVFLSCDREKLEQVIRNFVVNSSKFTPHNSTGIIKLSAKFIPSPEMPAAQLGEDKNKDKEREVVSGEVVIVVEDNGIGLFDSSPDRLFHQFAVSSSSKRCGIGLALSKFIIEQHGGSIGAQSKGKNGSLFFVKLPAELVPIEIAKMQSMESPLLGVASPALALVPAPVIEKVEIPFLRVLLTDDSTMGRKIVERWLHELNAVCAHAADGEQAITEIKNSLLEGNQRFDVVLMDYHMPGLEGPEVVKRIRDLGYRGCIIGLSSVTSQDEVREILDSGADAFLSKPFNFQQFKNIVAAYFAGQNQSDIYHRAQLTSNDTISHFTRQHKKAHSDEQCKDDMPINA